MTSAFPRVALTLAAAMLAGGCFEQAQTLGDTETTESAESAESGTSAATAGPAPTTGGTTDPGTTSGTTAAASDTAASDTAASGDDPNLPEGEGCCDPHRGPGCNEPDVLDCVCAVDVSCCAFDWASGCVGLATGACEATCQGSVSAGSESGSSGGETGTGGSTGAVSTSGSTSTTGDPGGDCCEIQDTPGCEDPVVETCTCELDAFCCDSAWDDLCVEQAVNQCQLVCP